MAKKFKAKEELVEAVYFNGDNMDEVKAFIAKYSSLTAEKTLMNTFMSTPSDEYEISVYDYHFGSNAKLHISYHEIPCYVYFKYDRFNVMSIGEFEDRYDYLGEISDD